MKVVTELRHALRSQAAQAEQAPYGLVRERHERGRKVVIACGTHRHCGAWRQALRGNGQRRGFCRAQLPVLMPCCQVF